ncbi:MAG: Bax inhibitor-1 family protein [Hyphomicrobiaceae bacterium]
MSKLDRNKTNHVDRLKELADRVSLRSFGAGSDADTRFDLETDQQDRRLRAHLTEVLDLVACALAGAVITGLIFALSSDGLSLLLLNPLYPTAVLLGVVSLPYIAPAASVTRDTELAKILLLASAIIWGLALAPLFRALPAATGVQLLVLAGVMTVVLGAGAALVGLTTSRDLRALSRHGRQAAIALIAATALALVFRLPSATQAALSVAVMAWSLVAVARLAQVTKDVLDHADDEDRRCTRAHIAATQLLGPILLTGAHLVVVLRLLPW